MGDDSMHVMMGQSMALFDEYQSKENAETANPRNTSTARLSLRPSSSSNLPMHAPTLVLGPVVILSTIRRHAVRKPLRSSFGLVVAKAQIVMESVASKLSS